MLQPWPENAPIDEEIELEVNWLKEVIQGVRRIRSELNIAPGKPLEIWFQGGGETDQQRLSKHDIVFSQLARAESIQWVDETADTAECAVALAGDLKVLVPLAGLIDVEAELSRLRKQLQMEKSHVDRCQAKLANKKFVENAPGEVVEQERQRLAEHQGSLSKLEEQVQKLEGMQ
jgi:valyl-tRNA synthetase